MSLGGRGQLRDWEVFNRPDKGKSPTYAFFSIWAQRGSQKPFSSVLESRIAPPYEGSSGLGSANVPGLPRLRGATFTGEFPLARIDFEDPDLPVRVTLEAFTPFIPLEADDSGLPVSVLRYRLSNPAAAPVSVSIAFSLDNPVGTQGRSCEYRKGSGIEGLVFQNPFLAQTDPLWGSFAAGILGGAGGQVSYLRGWPSGRWWSPALHFWDDFSSDGQLGPEPAAKGTVGSLCCQQKIPPRGKAEITFLLSWHFPNRTPERCGWSAPKGEEKAVIGNYYSTRFRDAWQAAEYTAGKLPALEARTRKFAQTMRESTLPPAVREAAMANLSTLVTPTCFRTADGEFHGFEGSGNDKGCCFGNCTHVWNYEPATAHLFGSLSRSLRGSMFGFCTDEEGRQDFRQLLPPDKQRWGNAAADGQMGQLMKLYLDWRLSGDTDWLKKLWPAAKRATEFAWIFGGWDADRDGVMEGVQHNTYDVEFYGPNPLCGIYYLGGLRAAEEMARIVGDTAFAEECRQLFERGSRWIDGNLFNGQFYIQQVRGIPKEKIAKGLAAGMGAADAENPDYQLGEGCLVDQLVGQFVAQYAGLGRLLAPEKILATLKSIYKYNHKKSLFRHESVQRIFALNDEAALTICDYPGGKRPHTPFPYFAEVMTGFEYSAAVLMLYEGMVAQGVELIENIRRRYDGMRRNPWNEAECGHHYARAMASWGGILALSGFRFHAANKTVIARPMINRERFRCFWSTATAWGSFTQTLSPEQKRFALSVEEGELGCRTVELRWEPGAAATSIAKLGGKEFHHEFHRDGAEVTFSFAEEVTLKAGDQLELLL